MNQEPPAASAFTFAPLSPASFLDRAESSFGNRTAVVDGHRRWTYKEFAARCRALAAALGSRGIVPGDRVAALCTNSHIMLELHHALPQAGIVLVSVNTRLSATEMRYILEHSRSTLLVATVEFEELARQVAAEVAIPVVVAGGPRDDYEALLADAHSAPNTSMPADEKSLLAINYTSGTTGRPKGVMYHHRGAYLQAVAMAYHGRLSADARYLWTLPMFHCNGWCFTWAVTAAGGTHVCLRTIDTEAIWTLLVEERVTNFSAAPTVLTMIAEDPAAHSLGRRVHVDTGGAPPSPSLLSRLIPLGFDVTHLYGLTETFGPVAINEWQPEWDTLGQNEASVLRARQGIGNIIAAPLAVLDHSGCEVPADGETMGEIAVRGNDVMLGYYRDPDATAAVTRNGHFLTGDLGVKHPDGYVEIRDRGKDIIISGGENISSVEVERAVDSHPDVLECAVVGKPDDRWGEVPVAYVTRRPGSTVSAEDLIAHARTTLARFKAPRMIVFSDLPKTSTGKIQKNRLRVEARAIGDNHAH